MSNVLMSQHYVNVEEYLSSILNWAKTYFKEEVFIKAKKYFFKQTGKIFDDEPFYEQRMNFFIDYFLFNTPIIKEYNVFITPYHLYLAKNSPNIEEFNFIYSIFQIIKNNKINLKILDLMTKLQYLVYPKKDDESFRFLENKAIFQGFLYCFKNKYYLSNGVIFHPTNTHNAIKKTLKQSYVLNRSSSDNIILLLNHLAKAQLQIIRQPKSNVSKIYLLNKL